MHEGVCIRMRIYTRLGDQGDTSLYTPKGVPQRLPKSSPRVEAYGTTDELNTLIGLLRAELGREDPLSAELTDVQNRLFHVGYDLSTMPQEGKPPAAVRAEDAEALEGAIDRMEKEIPPLRQFILPSGTRAAALAHVARTVARRAERRVVRLRSDEEVNPEVVRYLNRLSDYLFVLARYINHRDGGCEDTVDWKV